MRKLWILTLCLGLIGGCFGCTPKEQPAQIVATTLPVYEFTSSLCQGTDLSVVRLVNEEVSCLHDYSLQTRQMRAIENAQLVVISGGGLEDFLADAIHGQTVVDASAHVALHHGHNHDGHDHAHDPHIWLSPVLAKEMVENICQGLIAQYPEYSEVFLKNQALLQDQLDQLDAYGKAELEDLSCRKLITFHDGFTYLAEHYGLTILRAVEEESGSEASARELIDLICLVREHDLPAIFTEKSGSVSAAQIISRETHVPVYTLDMAMSGNSYFDAMYHNIRVLKEALQ